jgi:glutamate dehydrogenase (NADP+)
MTELSHYIGRLTDVPAGDIGVGGREIGYMFGQYKRMTRLYEGVLTGKGMQWGGSLIRPEATGYGCVFFARCAVEAQGKTLEGARCVISGSGNVAQYTAEKLLQLGAIPVSFSDSTGTIYEPDGFTEEKLKDLMFIKNVKRGRVRQYQECSKTAVFKRKAKPWDISCDYAFPSATQNEVGGEDAKVLIENGCKGVFEGANMPSSPEAIALFQQAGIIFAPGKAANAGGVAVSGLEMSQNAQMINWNRETVEGKLLEIMTSIHQQCSEAGENYGRPGDLKFGANVAGFLKVATAVQEQGV